MKTYNRDWSDDYFRETDTVITTAAKLIVLAWIVIAFTGAVLCLGALATLVYLLVCLI